MNTTGRAICAALLFIVGILVVGVAIFALIDPVGTKMADDNDPFGTPVPRLGSALVLIAGMSLVLAGGLIVRAAIRAERRLGSLP